MSNVYLDPKVWGPHYWFFLHTLVMTYPHHPNTVTKKKYYEFFQNLSLFLPVEEISSQFSKLLEKYPVSPYLDNRDSLVRWMHFIHNKINEIHEKPQISLTSFFTKYYDEYKSQHEKISVYYKIREKLIYFFILSSLIAIIYYLYEK